MDLEVERCNFKSKAHRDAVVMLIDAYMQDPMGVGKPFDQALIEPLLEGMSTHPSAFMLLARQDQQFVGLATCVIGFSTFQASPLINIHDIIVFPDFRGKGVGRILLKAVEEVAREMDCIKITLEVRSDNIIAQELYLSEGYGEATPPLLFWSKQL